MHTREVDGIHKMVCIRLGVGPGMRGSATARSKTHPCPKQASSALHAWSAETCGCCCYYYCLVNTYMSALPLLYPRASSRTFPHLAWNRLPFASHQNQHLLISSTRWQLSMLQGHVMGRTNYRNSKSNPPPVHAYKYVERYAGAIPHRVSNMRTLLLREASIHTGASSLFASPTSDLIPE